MTMKAKDAKFEVADYIRVRRLLLLKIAASSARQRQLICLVTFIDKVVRLYSIRVEELVRGRCGWPIRRNSTVEQSSIIIRLGCVKVAHHAFLVRLRESRARSSTHLLG